MVYRVLSVVAGILFALAVPVFAVCLVYTLASPAVQAGFDSVSKAIDSAVARASKAMDTDWGIDLAGIAASMASGGSPDEGGPDSAATSAAGRGDAFASWRDALGDPVAAMFGSTGVTASVLEGVAGGSASAADALAGLSETSLLAVDAAAASYASTVASVTIPASLPEAVRAKMWDAAAAARALAASVQTLMGVVRVVRTGDLAATADLVAAADEATVHLRAFDEAIRGAEGLL